MIAILRTYEILSKQDPHIVSKFCELEAEDILTTDYLEDTIVITTQLKKCKN